MSDTSGTVARVLSVLTVIAEAKGQIGVKDVADTLKLPMSTSHRLLDLLLDAGFVEKNQARRRYGVGTELLRLASLVTQKTPHVDLVQPALDRLTEVVGETAFNAVYLPAQRAMMFAAKSDSPNSLRFRVELFQQLPLEWGAAGLAILAHLPPDVQTEIFESAQPSPVSRKRLSQSAFNDRISVVRQAGHSLTDSERLPNSIGIGVPVMTARGTVAGSIALALPKVRFDQAKLEDIIALVKGEAARCSFGD